MVVYLCIDVDGKVVNVYVIYFNECSDENGQCICCIQVEDLLCFIVGILVGVLVVIVGDFNVLVDVSDLSELCSYYGDSYGSVYVNIDLVGVSMLNRYYYLVVLWIDYIFFQQDVMVVCEVKFLFDQFDDSGCWVLDYYGVWICL